MALQPKIALIYDKVNTKYGGAEIVLKALHRLYPEAPLFTSVYDQKNAAWADDFNVKTSFLQNIPLLNKYHRLLAPLMPLAFESHRLDSFDVLISVTSGEAKGIITKPNQLHICYMLTPPRYLYSHFDEYLENFRFFSLPVIRQISGVFLKYLKWWDQTAAHRPDHLIAISSLIEKRIKNFYERDVLTVIYPPFIEKNSRKIEKMPIKNYLLCVSRLVPYKKIDLCIYSAISLDDILLIAGSGPEAARLQNIKSESSYVRKANESINNAIKNARVRGKKIIFLGTVKNKEAARLFENAKVLLMPGTEDFGISAIDAAAKGIPSVISKESGAAEVLDKNCIKISKVTSKEISDAIISLSQRNIKPAALKKAAESLADDKFTGQFGKIVYDLFIQHRRKGPNVYL